MNVTGSPPRATVIWQVADILGRKLKKKKKIRSEEAPLLEEGKKGRRRERRRRWDEKEEAKAVVPRGCVAVYVGEEKRRFVIPAEYLGTPDFGVLMEVVAEKFGFEQVGGLRIPFDEEAFVEFLGFLEEKMNKKENRENRGERDVGHCKI
ncbi:Indole-3-acetic acid-induced protein ARG7 [Acorus calamus]|uniref:Indole-3-acetic acid-induced protein ARG7 n=1 Tax=Acorus calamus TaxID=4465 RepID=A0AAV9FBY2_ACOCL|nr:Indole-3-acetic acid-induced protein ARG7 [Acorus calamus]